MDYLDRLADLAFTAARAKGATVSVRLNAWPWEIPIARLADLENAEPGIVRGQVIVREAGGGIMAKLGPDVETNWLLTGAVVAGLGAVFFVVVRGLAR